MKAFAIKSYGTSVPLEQMDRPEPALKAGDVRGRIQAAAVNVLDSKIWKGEFRAFLIRCLWSLAMTWRVS